MKHLPFLSLARGRRGASYRHLVACAAGLCVLVSAATAHAQYGHYPYPQTQTQPQRYATHYGNPSTFGYGPAVAQNQTGTLFPRGASYYDPASAADPVPLPAPQPEQVNRPEAGEYNPTDGLWSGGNCADGSCGTCDIGCNPCGCNPWYVSLYALSMNRDMANRVWTSYESGNNPNQLTNTQDVDTDWVSGGELVIGRCLPCLCGWSLEGRYWQLDDMNGYNSTTHASTVSTPFDVSGIEFGATGAGAWFDGADEHRLSRDNQIYNFEVNLVRNVGCNGCDCGPWQVGGIVGFRYFKFDENLRFSSLANGGSWNTATDHAHIEDDISNELFGFQVGANIRRCFCKNWAFTFTPKVGVFANHIENRYNIYRGDGLAATPTAASLATGSYPVDGEADKLSLMLEANFGLAWQISCRWEATFGYRVMAFTGMGLADNQLETYVVDFPEFADVSTNGHLLLHGGYAGLTYRF